MSRRQKREKFRGRQAQRAQRVLRDAAHRGRWRDLEAPASCGHCGWSNGRAWEDVFGNVRWGCEGCGRAIPPSPLKIEPRREPVPSLPRQSTQANVAAETAALAAPQPVDPEDWPEALRHEMATTGIRVVPAGQGLLFEWFSGEAICKWSGVGDPARAFESCCRIAERQLGIQEVGR